MKNKISWKPYIVTGIISLAFAILLFILLWFVVKMSLVDSFSIPGVLLVSSSLLIWISREGFFDLFSYGVRQMKSMLFSKNPREYRDYPEYKNYKNQIREKRTKTYYIVAIVGVLFLLVSIIIYLVTKI